MSRLAMAPSLFLTTCLATCLALAAAPLQAAAAEPGPDPAQQRALQLERCLQHTGPAVWFTAASCPRDMVEAVCRHMQTAEVSAANCPEACRARRQNAHRLAHPPASQHNCLPWLNFAHAQCRQACGE